MAETQTPNFHWTKPDLGGDASRWGIVLNTAFDAVDAQVYVNQTNLGNYLPLAGGTVTGALTVNGAGTFGSISTTGTGTFGLVNVTGALTASGNLSVTGVATAGSLVSNGSLNVTGPASFNDGVAYIKSIAGQLNPALLLQDHFGTSRGSIQFFETAGTLQITNLAPGPATWLALPADGSFQINSPTASKPGGGSWAAPSDERIKTVTGDYEAGLDEVLQLRPVTYVYKGNDTPTEDGMSPHKDAAQSGKEFVGFVAQELEQIMPGMVSQHEGFIDGEKATDIRDVDVSSLVFALVNCVRQLKAEIEALKQK